MPTSPATAAAAASGHHDVYVKPGSSVAVSNRARNVSAQVTSSLITSLNRRPRRVGGPVRARLSPGAETPLGSVMEPLPRSSGRPSGPGVSPRERRDDGLLASRCDARGHVGVSAESDDGGMVAVVAAMALDERLTAWTAPAAGAGPDQ